MKKSQRMQAIVEIKALQEKQSLEVLAECQRRSLEAKQQLEHLQNYRQEYLDKFEDSAGGGMRVKVLLDFRAFIDKLDQAIAGQAQILQQTEFELVQKRKVWEGLYQHTQSLQKVCDSIVAEEVKIENKREQSESDDRSSRTIRGSSSGIGNA